MNKYPYKAGQNTSIYEKFIFDKKCIKCGCSKGFYCETPKGRRVWPPHNERIMKEKI